MGMGPNMGSEILAHKSGEVLQLRLKPSQGVHRPQIAVLGGPRAPVAALGAMSAGLLLFKPHRAVSKPYPDHARADAGLRAKAKNPGFPAICLYAVR